MRLVDIEKELKALIEKDITSPDVYNCLYKLSFQYLLHKKAISNYDDCAIVAHTMAEELYLKVYNGGHINSWLGYMSLSYHAFIRVWRNMTQSQIIDVEGRSDLEEAIVNMCTSSATSNSYDYQVMYDRSYLESIDKLVDLVVDNSAVPSDTKKSMNMKLSIMLSVTYGRYIEYHIDDADSNYNRLLYNKVIDVISNNLKSISVSNDSDGNCQFSLLQLYAMSNSDQSSN